MKSQFQIIVRAGKQNPFNKWAPVPPLPTRQEAEIIITGLRRNYRDYQFEVLEFLP